MKNRILLLITVMAAILACVFMFQTSPASAGGTYPTTTTKATYPTSTTKVTYPTTTTVPRTTTTKVRETTTTVPKTTTTVPKTTTTQEQTTTTQEQTTTTVPETTTTNPNLTILSLRAVVIGGPATPADFDLFASGPIDINGITDNPNVTFRVVDPGSYALSFVADAIANDPYTNQGWDCVGSASTTTESVTLDAGEDALCVITFTTTAAVTTTTLPGATTTAPGATTTAPGATTTAPTGTTTPEITTLTPTGEEVTPAAEAPILATPASTSLAVTGSDIRMGLGSGLFLITLGGLVLLLIRRVRK